MKAKIKIMKTRPEVTDEEIKTFMDFDALLDRKDKLSGSQRNVRGVRNLFTGVACLLSVSSLIFFFSERKASDQPMAVSPQDATAPARRDTIQSSRPSKEGLSPVAPQERKEKEITAKEIIAQQEEGPAEHKEVLPAQPVYTQAEPVAGYPALYDYFEKNLVYPPLASEPVQGVVDVTFVIDTVGRAINITIENSLGSSFDEEVIRLMKKMPPWRPASYNGKAVQSKISLPITFSVKKTANP